MKPQEILHHYDNESLLVESLMTDIVTLKTAVLRNIRDGYDWYYGVKPIFNPLSSLTKEIVVEGYNEGKPFLPCQHLIQKEIDHWCMHWDAEFVKFLSLEVRKNSVVMVPQFITIENREILEQHITVNISNPNLKTFTKLIQMHFCPWQSELEEGSWIDATTLTKAV